MYLLPLHKKFLIAALLFIAAGIVSITRFEPLWMFIPFTWVLFYPLKNIIVYKTHWLFYLLIFLLPLSTEYNFTPTLGIDFPDEPVMMLITAVFILIIIHKPLLFPLNVLKHPVFLFIIIHLFWIFIAAIYSTNFLLSTKMLLAKTWFIVPFVIVPSMFNWSKKRLRILGFLILVPMLFVVAQSVIRHAFFQFSFQGIKHTLSPFFRNHVNYSAMLVCLLPVMLLMKSCAKQQHIKYWNVALLLAVAGVVLAYSRGAWLALFCGIIAVFIFYFKWVKKALLIFILGLLVAGFWLVKNNNYLRFSHNFNSTIFHEDLSQHLSATVQLKDVSNAERFYRWIAAGNMVADKPITGFGPNTFYQNYKNYTEAPFRTWVSDNPEKSTVHNYFLLTLVEQGMPGFIFFSLLFITMLLHSEKLYHQLYDRHYKNLALAIGVILIMIGSLLFSSDLVETDKIGSLFWLSAGFIIVLQRELEKQTDHV